MSGRCHKLFSVYDNRQGGLPVVVGVIAPQAAKAMGVQPKYFYQIRSHCRAGRTKRWTIIEEDAERA